MIMDGKCYIFYVFQRVNKFCLDHCCGVVLDSCKISALEASTNFVFLFCACDHHDDLGSKKMQKRRCPLVVSVWKWVVTCVNYTDMATIVTLRCGIFVLLFLTVVVLKVESGSKGLSQTWWFVECTMVKEKHHVFDVGCHVLLRTGVYFCWSE